MAKAIWNGAALAESDKTEIVEGNHYFPPDSVEKELFKETDHHAECPWRGAASYYSIEVDGEVNENAAWCPDRRRAKRMLGEYQKPYSWIDVEGSS